MDIQDFKKSINKAINDLEDMRGALNEGLEDLHNASDKDYEGVGY